MVTCSLLCRAPALPFWCCGHALSICGATLLFVLPFLGVYQAACSVPSITETTGDYGVGLYGGPSPMSEVSFCTDGQRGNHYVHSALVWLIYEPQEVRSDPD